MEYDQIEQRMKLAQRIRDIWRESRDVRDLVDILHDHTFGSKPLILHLAK